MSRRAIIQQLNNYELEWYQDIKHNTKHNIVSMRHLRTRSRASVIKRPVKKEEKNIDDTEMKRISLLKEMMENGSNNVENIIPSMKNMKAIIDSNDSSKSKKSSQKQSTKKDQVVNNNNEPKKKKSKGKNSILEENDEFRAERVVSIRGSISRSEASNAIKSRKVGYKLKEDEPKFTPIRSTKLKIPLNAIIYMNGVPLPPIPPMLVVYHKPKNVLSAMDEKHSKTKKHLGMVLSETHKKFGMHPVGRLDYDTSGLILFSRNGDLTQRLLHPKYKIEKEYVATVSGDKVDFDTLKEKLEIDGVETTEGTHFAKLLGVQSVSVKQSASILKKYLKSRLDEGMEEKDPRIVEAAESDDHQLHNVRITVQEGKYRMVRRMLANCGHPVVELKRERHGSIELNDLCVGEFRDCTEKELNWANDLLG